MEATRSDPGYSKRRSKRSSSEASRRTIRSSSQSVSLQTKPQYNQMTPPLTPNSSRTSLIQEEREVENSASNDEPTAQPLNATFLRAFYSFTPPTSRSSSTVTLPLSVGDLLLVHNVHINGWADGTILGTGARGWLPTNYCEVYNVVQMKLLLEAVFNLLESCRITVSTGNSTSIQQVVGEMINGVRSLLVSQIVLVSVI